MSGRLAASLVCVCLASACGADSPRPPTARIAASPLYLPLGDEYHTDVLLDGTASRDEIDDPDQLVALAYRWEVDDPHTMITAGSLDAARVTVRLAGEAATEVRLFVTSRSGASGSAVARIGVTVPL